MGRVLTAAETIPGSSMGTKTTSYAYDSGAGDKLNRSRMTWPDGYYVAYAYDALNKLLTETDSDGTVVAARTYDHLARPATTQYPNTNDNLAYSWDNQDNMLSLADNFTGSAADVTFTNSFTPANQIAGATISKSNYRYTPAASGTDSYGTVNGLNQYPTVTPAASSAQTVSYDARGNLICAGTSCPTGTPGANAWVYAYDPENRMLTAGNGTIAASYAYDPLGRRITKSGTGVTTTNFVHDGDSEIAEYDASGALVRRYVPGPVVDQPVAMVACTGSGCTGSNATKTFFHTDKMGTVIAMSSTTGSRTEGPYLYDSYGNCYNPNGTACSNGVPYRFTGQRLDPETGLHYYRARYYSSSLGRFMQTDPVGYKDDLDLYTYVGDDPTDKVDPSGNESGPVFTADTRSFPTPNDVRCPSTCAQPTLRDIGYFVPGVGTILTIQDAIDDPTSENIGFAVLSVIPDVSALAKAGKALKLFDREVVVVTRTERAAAEGEQTLADSAHATCCFVAGTPVATATGNRPIEQIKVGDLVLSRDPGTGSTAYKPVLNLVRRHHRDTYIVTFNVMGADGTIATTKLETTDDHPWRSVDGRWLTTLELVPGSSIQREKGRPAQVVSVTKTGLFAKTYNLEVADFHTYFVGPEHIWVHNTCEHGHPGGKGRCIECKKKTGHRTNTRKHDKHTKADARRAREQRKAEERRNNN